MQIIQYVKMLTMCVYDRIGNEVATAPTPATITATNPAATSIPELVEPRILDTTTPASINLSTSTVPVETSTIIDAFPTTTTVQNPVSATTGPGPSTNDSTLVKVFFYLQFFLWITFFANESFQHLCVMVLSNLIKKIVVCRLDKPPR